MSARCSPSTLGGLRGLAALLSSCAFPERTLVSPPAAEVRAVALRALALVDSTPVDSSDFAVAAALGWALGLPGVDLVVRDAEGGVVAVATTEADGTVLLPELAVGPYEVEGRRLFTDAERAAVTAFGAEGFVGFASLTVGPDASADPLEVRFPVSYRRGLVLSEWGFIYARIAPLEYNVGGYAEIYNNGPEIAYLDGMVLAEAYNLTGAPPTGTQWNCELARPIMEDPDGLWTIDFAQFPGGGSDYPILPGQTVIVAMDAIDHRDLFPEMLDLSGADFELEGGPDNPAVPDVYNRSVRRALVHEHGPNWRWLLSGVAVLARAADVSTYTVGTFPLILNPLRIPASDVVDVLTARNDWTSSTPGYRHCERYVLPQFDRAMAVAISGDGNAYLASITRRVLYVDSNGRAVLQHTRTSSADWVKSDRTPGVIVP